MASAGVAGVVRFGAFEFDLATRELRKQGIRLRVADQSLEILAMLVAEPGTVVSREAIRARLWPHGTVVEFEHSVNAAIKRLRDALADSAATPRYIETLPKKGYRFIAAVESDSPLPGIRNYRIVGELGRGGMGVVYRATDLRLGRDVAIKVLPPEFASDSQRRARLMREARAASALNHPNIVTVYEVGSDAGADFIAMELVAGKPLSALIPPSGMPSAEVVKLATQIADGLAKAHSAGIVHRDLKPGNIMVTDEGQVKLLDFGLAKVADAPTPAEAPTRTAQATTTEGAVMGTTGYMSPEQAQGKPVDPRSDIFSFGTGLYEMITGTRAFERDSYLSTLAAIVNEEPEPPSKLSPATPAGLEHVIRRCLEKDRAKRFQHASELKLALEQLGQSAEPRPTARRARWPRWVYVPLATVGALAVVGGAVFLVRSQTEQPGPPGKETRFAARPGDQNEPAFSPDGKQLAFTWDGDRANGINLYVQLVEDGTLRRITRNPGFEYSPSWSPDGLHIALARRTSKGTDIVVAPAAGGDEVVLRTSIAGCGTAPRFIDRVKCGLSWSPDGRFLAIVDRDTTQAPNSIYLLDVKTRETRQLVRPPKGFEDGMPSYSPDGRALAFLRTSMGLPIAELYTVELAGSGLAAGSARQTSHDNAWILGIDWTADSREIVFSSNRGGLWGLWRVPWAGGPGKRLAAGSTDATFPTVARRGGRLAYVYGPFDFNLWRIRPPRPGMDPREAVPLRVTASPHVDSDGTFSRDGRIAWTSTDSGNHQIWVSAGDGSDPRRITDFGSLVHGPVWSPDGSQIAFRGFINGQPRGFVVRLDTRVPRRLTNADYTEFPVYWSADGQWIYLCAFQDGEESIWRVRVADAPAEPVLVMRKGDWPVIESEDGKSVFLPGAAGGIWRVPLSGEAPVLLAANGRDLGFKSPDGRFLYYAGTDQSIWKVPINGGPPAVVMKAGERGRARWTVADAGIYLLDPDAAGGVTLGFVSFDAKRRQTVRLPGDPEDYIIGPGWVSVSPDGKWLLYHKHDPADAVIMLVEKFR